MKLTLLLFRRLAIKINISFAFLLFLFLLWSCDEDMAIDRFEYEPNAVSITPDNYRVISKISSELLSCGPVAIAHNNSMTIVYLADEVSPVETESSKTIFLRCARFNLYEAKEDIKFLDIAKANTMLNGFNIGKVIPYEPNLTKLDDSTLLAMFRIGGTKGEYYSCQVDTESLVCENFCQMTLDKHLMNSANVRMSYEQLTESTMSDTPTLVFTTRIINKDGFFYSHLGGYGYNGIVVKSKNGIDWESVFVPTYVEHLSYILEGALGEDPKTGNIFLCARGDNMVLYSYDKEFNTIARPRLLAGTTTSKPTFFCYHDNLYLIVNMEKYENMGFGRRNTAHIYKVNGDTGNMELTKVMQCREGCSYHSVQVINDDIWVVFQTDARHIALENQGRSNLALYKLQMD